VAIAMPVSLTGTDIVLLGGIVALAAVLLAGLWLWHRQQVRLADDRLFLSEEGAAHALSRCLDQCSDTAVQEIMARFAKAEAAVQRQMGAMAVGYASSTQGRRALEHGGELYEQTLLAAMRGLTGETPPPDAPGPTVVEGRAEVRSVDVVPQVRGLIANLRMVSGSLRRGASVRLLTAGGSSRATSGATGRIAEVRVDVNDVEQVTSGECAVLITDCDGLRVGDLVEAYSPRSDAEEASE
jgi:hypothetical protein